MRLGALAVVALFCATSCSRCSPKTMAPDAASGLAQQEPEAFLIHGVVVDAEQQPVGGATVSLFPDGQTWAPDSFGGPTDEERDCLHAPLACPHTRSARAQVWRQLDAGTLQFPRAAETVTSAADGTFAIRASVRGGLLTASKGDAFDWEAAPASEWDDVRLELEPAAPRAERAGPAIAVTQICPFTREIIRGDDVSLHQGCWLGVEDDPASRVTTTFEVRLDGGLVEATLELDCESAAFTLRTDGGHATVTRPAGFCPLEVRSAEGWYRGFSFERQELNPIELLPRRRATVRWSPAVRLTEVRLDHPPTGFGGTRGGGWTPGFGRFDGGVAHFDPILIRGDVERLQAYVRQPGFVEATVPFEIGPQPAEVTVELTAVKGMTGRVVDARGRGVPGLSVSLSRLDGGFAGGGATDERGAFELVPRSAEAFMLSAGHPFLGHVTARSDVHQGTLTLQQTATLELTVEAADGGPLRNTRVSVASDDGHGWAQTNDAGVLLVPGLAPGEQALRVGRTPELLSTVTTVIPDAGTVRATVRLVE